MGLTGMSSPNIIRAYANIIATTATTTQRPAHQEMMHMIQMLRTEACSGATHDNAHIRT